MNRRKFFNYLKKPFGALVLLLFLPKASKGSYLNADPPLGEKAVDIMVLREAEPLFNKTVLDNVIWQLACPIISDKEVEKRFGISPQALKIVKRLYQQEITDHVNRWRSRGRWGDLLNET